MATVEEKDREEARRLLRKYVPPSQKPTHATLTPAVAQALATARAEGAAEEREASKLCPNCVVLAGWKPGDRCAARWWSTISDCELVCEDPATHATIAAPTCSRHARDGALPIDEFFREEDIIRRRLAAIRSRGPAPERPAVGSCGWHPCGTCADKRACMKPVPVDPVREAAKARLVSGHNDTCASMLDSKYDCSCGHSALAAALEKSE